MAKEVPGTVETSGAAHRSTVIVTRPKEDATPLIESLRERGHAVVAFPVLGIEPVDDARALAATMARIPAYRLVVFVSPNAIRHALAYRTESWPREVMIAVMGPGSVAALEGLGIGAPEVEVLSPSDSHRPLPDASGTAGPHRRAGRDSGAPRDLPTPVPAFDTEAIDKAGHAPSLRRFDSEALLATLEATLGTQAGFDGRVLIVRGNGGRAWFADQLRERGIAVDEIESYRRVRPTPDPVAVAALRRLFSDHADAIFIVTSSEGLANLVAMVEAALGSAAREWLFNQLIVASHARIAEQARRMGFSKLKSAAPGDEGMVAAIE